jgi:PAS domain S-box-containing protein
MLLCDRKKHEIDMQENSIGGDCHVICSPIFNENGELIGSIHLVRDINELKAAEKSLKENEDRYRNIIALAGGIAYQRDWQNETYTFMDEGIEELTGYSVDEISPQLFEDIADAQIPGGYESKIHSELSHQIGGENAILYKGEYLIRTRDGQIKYVADSSIELMDSDNNVIQSFGMLQDITERKIAEEQLKASEEKYRTIFDSSSDAIIIHDLKGYILEVNKTAIKQLGYSREELLNMPPKGIDSPDFYELISERMKQLVKEGYVFFEMEFIAKGGRKIPVELSSKIIDYNGMPAVLSIARDITERKQAELKIQENEQLYHNTIESAGAVPYRRNYVTNSFEFIGEGIRALTGYSADVFTVPLWRSIIQELVPSGKFSGMVEKEAVQKAISEKSKSFQWDVRIKAANGEERWLLDSSSQIRDENGQLIMEIGILQDITEQKHKQIEYQTILHTSLDGFIIVNMEGNIIEVNESYCLMTGYTRDEILKMKISDIDANESLEDTKKHMQIMIENGSDRFESKHKCKDGSLIDVEVSITYERHKNSRFYAFIRDITERKHAEELQIKLQQTSKMESIGRLAGGVAHDFNNMLTVIQGSTTLAMMGLNANDPIFSRLKIIEEASNRASALTRQLLAFSRKQIIEPKIINLNDVINNLEKMLARLIGEDIKLQKFLGDDLANINADAGQIEQVIVNLAVNSRDAMPNGGIFTIETENIFLDEYYCQKHPNTLVGDYVLMTISDNGCGMSEETKRQIFEPFFTTKKSGEGTGLGLATVYGIVKQHNGYIECYSEIGHGTTFKIYLPQVNKDSSFKTSKENIIDEEKITKSNETILLIEDEDIVREITFEFLKQLGYKVLIAENGGSALIIAEQYTQTIHLLMTDVIMPGLNGREVAERLLKIHPEMKVLYTSGYTQNIIAHHGILEEGLNFISKPYRFETLAKKIKDVLSKKD